MAVINKSEVRTGFMVAIGFFLFGLLAALFQYVLLRYRFRQGGQ